MWTDNASQIDMLFFDIVINDVDDVVINAAYYVVDKGDRFHGFTGNTR